MGTHPIFESDFDCLTDFSTKWVWILKLPLTKLILIIPVSLICKKLKFFSRESKLSMMPKSKHFSRNTTLTEMDFLIVKNLLLWQANYQKLLNKSFCCLNLSSTS